MNLFLLTSFRDQVENTNAWRRKNGQQQYCKAYKYSFSMSFIVAFSSLKFYGIMSVDGRVDSTIFEHFLKSLINQINKNDLSKMKSFIIMENASVHKAEHIK